MSPPLMRMSTPPSPQPVLSDQPYVSYHTSTLHVPQEPPALRRERQAAEGEREHLVLAAQDAGKAHAGHAAQLEALEAELEARERAAALAQQQYIQARNAAQATAEDVAQLRSAALPARGCQAWEEPPVGAAWNCEHSGRPAYRQPLLSFCPCGLAQIAVLCVKSRAPACT